MILKISDEKGNKSTYTSKQGKEVALPGVQSMLKFFGSIKTIEPTMVMGEVEHYGDKIQAMCLNNIQGKKLQIGVNQYENFYNGETSVRNDIKYWLDADGKNSGGEDLTEKVVASLEKNPLKKLKASASAGATTNTATTAAAGSSW